MSPKLNTADLETFLNEKYVQYARPEFINDDPVQIPRRFSERHDQEIMGFLAATIAWGQRKTIIANCEKLIRLLEHEPHAFVLHASDNELASLSSFVHRTFNGEDLITFVLALRSVYNEYGSLEPVLLNDGATTGERISMFKKIFFRVPHAARTEKHVADPMKGSSAKRINMFLRWMVRPSDNGIDLGIWSEKHLRDLHVPLDVHTGNTARALGLLTRKQNDWKAVQELTERLRMIDPEDPVRFDIPLFAIGVYEPELISGQPVS